MVASQHTTAATYFPSLSNKNLLGVPRVQSQAPERAPSLGNQSHSSKDVLQLPGRELESRGPAFLHMYHTPWGNVTELCLSKCHKRHGVQENLRFQLIITNDTDEFWEHSNWDLGNYSCIIEWRKDLSVLPAPRTRGLHGGSDQQDVCSGQLEPLRDRKLGDKQWYFIQPANQRAI